MKFDGDTFLEDRVEDFFMLMKLQTAEGKEAARKSLEAFGTAGGTGKLWFKDVEKVYETGYRYSNFDPRFDLNGNPVPGAPKLTTTSEPAGGWYTSFDKFDDAATAKSKMQLPMDSTAKYRLEFDWDAVKEKTRIPRGDHHLADYFEPLCRDYLDDGGLGGATQVAIEGIDIPIKSIWDISGSIPVQIY